MEKRKRIAASVLFGIYAAVMLRLLFLREPPPPGLPYREQLHGLLNLIPLRTIRLFLNCFRQPWRPNLVRAALVNLFGNVLMFLPLGFFPPFIFPKLRTFLRVILTAAVIMTAVEVTQMLLLVGTCDIDDLILNLIGTAIGYGFWKAFDRSRE